MAKQTSEMNLVGLTRDYQARHAETAWILATFAETGELPAPSAMDEPLPPSGPSALERERMHIRHQVNALKRDIQRHVEWYRYMQSQGEKFSLIQMNATHKTITAYHVFVICQLSRFIAIAAPRIQEDNFDAPVFEMNLAFDDYRALCEFLSRGDMPVHPHKIQFSTLEIFIGQQPVRRHRDVYEAILLRFPLRFNIKLLLQKQGVEPNPGPVVIDGMRISYANQMNDAEHKHRRSQYVARQRDEKNKSNILQYQRDFQLIHPAQRGGLTGEHSVDLEYFHSLLVEYGYASSRLLLLPSYLLKRVFTLYIEGYGLQHYEKLLRLFLTKKISDIPLDNRTPEAGSPARRLLVKFFFWSFADKFPHLNACISEPNNQMFEGLMGNIGSKIAEGFKKEVLPVWESLVSNITGLKDSAMSCIQDNMVFLGVFAFGILIGTIGIGVIYRYRSVLFVDSSTNEESDLENQMLSVSTGLITKTFTSWMTYMGVQSDRFIAKFNETHLTGAIDKFGKLASAFNNIYTMFARLRDVVKYIIDKSWSFITGVPFFQSTRQVQEVVTLVNGLMSSVRVGDIENKGNDVKCEFIQAFESLVELAPYIGRFDPALTAQINQALAAAIGHYNAVKETVRFVNPRQKPVFVYLYGAPGRGKSVFSYMLAKLTFDYLKVHHTDVWREIGREHFDQSLIYPRQSEQEYWDRYANQWVCNYDDLFQQTDPDGIEAFSLIRAKCDAPYPLHMASIARKENTTFQSKLIIASSNAEEESLKGLQGIRDYRAFTRRRDIAIHVDRTDDSNGTEDFDSVEALENLKFIVSDVHPTNGTLENKTMMNGIEGTKEIVKRIVKFYLRYHRRITRVTKTSELPKDFWSSDFKVRTIDGSAPSEEDKSSSSSSSSSSSTTANSDSVVSSTAQNQGWFQRTKGFVDSLQIATYFPTKVHDSFKSLIKTVLGLTVQTYEEAKLAVERLRTIDPRGIFADSRFNDTFIRYGVTFKKKFTWENVSYQLLHTDGWVGYLALYAKVRKNYGIEEPTDQQKLLRLAVNEKFGTHFEPHDIRHYLGLMQKIYHHAKRNQIIDFLVDNGFDVITYDQMKMLDPKDKDYEQDEKHQRMLLAYKGDSCILAETRRVRLCLAALAAGATVAAGICIIVSHLFPQYQTQSNAKYLEKLRMRAAKRPLKTLGRLANAQPQTLAQAQAFCNQFTDEQTRSICPTMANNLYAIEVETTNGDYFSQYASGIESCIFVTAAHLFEVPNIALVRLYPTEDDANSYLISFQDIRWQFVSIKGDRSSRDLVLFSIPSSNFVRKITHHLPKRGEVYDNVDGYGRIDKWENMHPESGVFMTCEDGKLVPSKKDSNFIIVSGTRPSRVIDLQRVGDCKTMMNGCYQLFITHNTQKGDCGKPYLWFNPQIPHKIIGYHCAGDALEALIAPLYQEDVEEFKKWLESKSTPYQNQFRRFTLDDVHIHPDDDLIVTPDYDGSYLGMPQVAKLSQKFVWPRKSKLMATPLVKKSSVLINGVVTQMEPPFPVLNAPALLFKKGDLDPVPISMRNLKTKVNRYTRDFREREFYDGIFGPATNSCTGKFLSKTEAIKGVVGWMHSHVIPRNTSMAFYFQKEGNKGHFVLTAQEHYDALHLNERGRFRQLSSDCWLDYRIDDLIDRWFEAVRIGKIPPNCVLFCLKDEPRPLDRVAMGKTRAFFMGPFVLMVVTKMIFGDFFNCLETNHSQSDSAVGINPYSVQWKILHDYLAAYGTDAVDDDVSGFDQHFPVLSFTDGFPEMYCQYFSIPAESFEAACVFASIYSNLCVYVVIEDKVYLLLFMPSGVLITCIVNTIENSIENRSIIKTLVPNKHFDDVARQKCFGDDILQVVKKEFHDRVTRTGIRKIAKDRFGHERTDSAKSNAETGFSDLHDAWFLQRKLKPVPGGVLCPLNIDSINCMLQWIMKPKDKTPEAQFRINCDVALMELARHSKVQFESYKSILNSYLAMSGQSYVYRRTYEEMYIDVLTRMSTPQ